MAPRLVMAALSLCVCFAWGFVQGCGPGESGAQVAFVLVNLDEVRSGGSMQPRDTLDRQYVVEATCQVFMPGSDRIYFESFPVQQDDETIQEGHVANIPPAAGYFARILGLTEGRSIWQCGASGPFDLRPGEKEFVVIAIGSPPHGNEYCEQVCSTDADCPGGSICPSPCAGGDWSQPCTPALCTPG